MFKNILISVTHDDEAVVLFIC